MAALKLVHIGCAVIWLGNFVVTGVWSIRAFATNRPELRRFAVTEILFTDAIFTLTFGAAVTISGVFLATRDGVAIWNTLWTRTALEIIAAAGVIWLLALLPLEIRMYARVKAQLPVVATFVLWNVLGWLITLALFVVIYLMVAKPV